MIFEDRKEAGKLLGEFVKGKISSDNLVVLGIPRGGMVVAKEVANALNVPLGVLIVRKLGVPTQPELAFGAVDPDGEVYIDKYTVEYFKLDKKSIQEVVNTELEKIKERERKLLSDKLPKVEGKNVLVVDDGIATGYTVIAGVNYLKRHGACKVFVAVPVCPADSIPKLKQYVDEVYCYYQVRESPYAVGMFYTDFRQVEDEEVEQLLKS